MVFLDIKDYDIVNYKKPSMFIICPRCSFKCGIEYCQNYQLSFETVLRFSNQQIIDMYNANPLTKAIVFGGLEPFDTFDEMICLIKDFREVCNDDIVIYTGYYSYEILDKIKELCSFKNIIIKFGRYIEGDSPHYDEVLGVNLASNNQFAVRLQNSPEMINALMSNEGHCPCAFVQDDTTLCCCEDFRNTKTGECHCGLYLKE